MKRNVFLSILVISLGVFGYYFQTKTLPLKPFATNYISKDLDISIDHRGVPFIKASSWKDAQFGLGYMMAKDRLWQMEILRRASAGRLSEYFGEKTIKMDKLMRTLRLRALWKSIFLKTRLSLKY